VNRLSRGTEAVARGDFSVRIPAGRRDQLGDLQRSYNAMAEHLSELVETAAQKEALDKELALARQVQEDLLPDEISPRKGLEIATHFEPSSAIGGDYFDVLERPGGRVAIVIADVAGHGLAAGLRMVMVKSALELLVADGQPAAEALSRLHRLVRRRAGDRAFVTLSFADLDPANGRLELTNAGHPPCYIVRGAGRVEEIVVPGLPLGSLDGRPGRTDLLLEPGDSFLLLSDGIVECRDGRGDPFGFERVQAALAGSPAATATMLVRRILDAVSGHCGDQPVEDDRTIVAVTYRAAETGGGTSPSPSEILRT
jgi:sigma-B regulation protein RsbU (phosphoserine phosphatase)